MKILLDTHVFLWIFLDEQKLSEHARALIGNQENEIWLSPITTWECHLLAEKRRVDLPPDPDTWLRSRLEELAPSEARINHEIALASRRLDLPHNDPADRFLGATANVYDLQLMTADQNLLASAEISTVKAN